MSSTSDVLARLGWVVLTGTFAWAAAAKALRFASWREALARYGLVPPVEASARVAVPAAEAVVVALLVAGSAKAAAAFALAILASFSFVLFAAARRHGNRLPCGCFGRATTRDYRVMLLRNVVLAGCAGLVLAGPARLDVTSGMQAPSGSEIVPALFVALGVALCALVAWQVEAASRRGRRR